MDRVVGDDRLAGVAPSVAVAVTLSRIRHVRTVVVAVDDTISVGVSVRQRVHAHRDRVQEGRATQRAVGADTAGAERPRIGVADAEQSIRAVATGDGAIGREAVQHEVRVDTDPEIRSGHGDGKLDDDEADTLGRKRGHEGLGEQGGARLTVDTGDHCVARIVGPDSDRSGGADVAVVDEPHARHRLYLGK